MIKNKLKYSIPWENKTLSFNIFIAIVFKSIIKNIFIKHNIFISNIFYHEYPKAINVIFDVFILNNNQYNKLVQFKYLIESVFYLIQKKNINITFNCSPNLLFNNDIFSKWLELKIYNEPNQIKRHVKQILKQYDTITK